jgi:hypothetical protein
MDSPTPASKEVAERIYQRLLIPATSLEYGDPTDFIASELTAFAERARKEGFKKGRLYKLTYWTERVENARKKALLEAAGVAEVNDGRTPGSCCEREALNIASHIKALAGKKEEGV